MSEDDDRLALGHAKTLLSDLPPPPDDVTLRSLSDGASRAISTGATRVIATEEPFGKQTLASVDAPRPPRGGDVSVGQILAGKYELERLLGQGGMGKVYKGTHRGLGIPIAVKTMHPEIAATPDYVRRFRHEAHAASLLNHPNAVRVLDFGDEDGVLYRALPRPLAAGARCATAAGRGGEPPGDAARRLSGGALIRHRAPRSEAGQRAAHQRSKG
jgi:hypothetical protein